MTITSTFRHRFQHSIRQIVWIFISFPSVYVCVTLQTSDWPVTCNPANIGLTPVTCNPADIWPNLVTCNPADIWPTPVTCDPADVWPIPGTCNSVDICARVYGWLYQNPRRLDCDHLHEYDIVRPTFQLLKYEIATHLWSNLNDCMETCSLDFLSSSPAGQMATISQTIFSNAFSWMKQFIFWLKFLWILLLRAQFTITQHWFR